MSLYDYDYGRILEKDNVPFYALIQAAMRRADSTNLELLKGCWPEIWDELQKRYNSPGGILRGELDSAGIRR